MKIVVVCGAGVGSSMVLKINIEKALRRLNIEATVEQSDITVAGSMNADLFVTSDTFARLLDEKYGQSDTSNVIVIKNYIDQEEYITKLEKAIKKMKG
jgi:PTS system ascorbate-specific IIB component